MCTHRVCFVQRVAMLCSLGLVVVFMHSTWLSDPFVSKHAWGLSTRRWNEIDDRQVACCAIRRQALSRAAVCADRPCRCWLFGLPCVSTSYIFPVLLFHVQQQLDLSRVEGRSRAARRAVPAAAALAHALGSGSRDVCFRAHELK